MATLSGQTIGQYRIIEKIGAGGMAEVYKAYQPGLARYVAVKVLPEYHQLSDESFLARFQREARAIAQLSHPNILPVHDFGQEGDLAYIVMQYVEGGTLKDIMGQPMELERAADFVDQVAGALDHAHKRGILHRDVKPSNILLEEGRRALLTDFGLAKMMEGAVQLTGTGVGVGTPTYMSPEQGRGGGVDARTDVYALGVVLYEMVTGRVPYEAETPMAVVLKHISEPPPPPRTVNPGLPQEVGRVILKALAKDKESRYASAGEMASALRQALAAGPAIPTFVPAQPPSASVTRPAPPPSATWQAPQTPPPPAPAAWQPPAPPPPYIEPSPVIAPRTGSALPWLLVGGGVVVLLLLAGLAGLLLLSQGRPGTSTPVVPGSVPVTQPVPTSRPTNTPEAPGPPQFGEITFALGYSKEKLEPISPATSFAAGVTEIHAIFEYSGMSNDRAWERVLYRDDNEMLRNSAQWNAGPKGIFDYYINTQGEPLAAGDWRLELYVEGQLLSQGSFTIKSSD